MKTTIKMFLAALAAGWGTLAFADGDSFELVPLTPDDTGWRISAGVRTAPKLKTKTKAKAQSLRELARALHHSPSHICRVMRGKRVSARLSRLLAKRGIKTAKEGK